MTDLKAPFTVYAPGGAGWQHPTLTRWAWWLREHGWRGRLPRGAVRECQAVWPAPQCACGMYHVVWLTGGTDGGEEDGQPPGR